jgi:hypothetical protein
MYAVNSRYYSCLALIFEEVDKNFHSSISSDNVAFEHYWNKYMPMNKWLAFSPSFAYQQAGYSDIQKKHTDNTANYFSKAWRKD